MRTEQEVIRLWKEIFAPSKETDTTVEVNLSGVKLTITKPKTNSVGTVISARNISFHN